MVRLLDTSGTEVRSGVRRYVVTSFACLSFDELNQSFVTC